MNPNPHHAEMYHLPNVAHGRHNLNPEPMLAGIVDVSVLKKTHANVHAIIDGVVQNPQHNLTHRKANVTRVSDVPATKVPLGMVQLELH